MKGKIMRDYVKRIARKFSNDEAGATAIEYGLIAALVSVVIIGAVTAIGTGVNDAFDTVAGALNGAVDSGD